MLLFGFCFVDLQNQNDRGFFGFCQKWIDLNHFYFRNMAVVGSITIIIMMDDMDQFLTVFVEVRQGIFLMVKYERLFIHLAETMVECIKVILPVSLIDICWHSKPYF